MLPKISILIPVYNVEKYIERCLRSVAEQTYEGEMECIIVDDCGTDGSMTLAKKFVSEYSGAIDFCITRHEKNRGSAAARNTLIDAATSDFVVWVDADDVLCNNAVELMTERQKDEDADMVFSDYYIETENGQERKERNINENKEKFLLDILGFKNRQHYLWGMMTRTSLYKDNNIYCKEGVNIGEDFLVLSQLLYYAKKIAKVDKPLYIYNRLNEDSYTHVYTEDNGKQDLETFDVLREAFMDKKGKYIGAIDCGEAIYLHTCLSNHEETIGADLKKEMIRRFNNLSSYSKRNISPIIRFFIKYGMFRMWNFYKACSNIKYELYEKIK